MCSTISLKSCNLAQILQSPKSEFVTCVMLSTHTNTSLIKPHLTELDEIHRNRPKSNYNLAKNLQSWSVTSDIRHRTEIHTFFIWYPRVGREHNSPSGNNRNKGSGYNAWWLTDDILNIGYILFTKQSSNYFYPGMIQF